MKCPFCDYEDTKVIDSRPSDSKIRRRRECIKCQKGLQHLKWWKCRCLWCKKDGSVEPFDRNKLITGIYSSIKKRPVSVDAVSKMVDSLESYYANEMRNQITTAEIGDMVLEKLKEIDLIAYIRFASVYKEFTDIDSFIKVISELSVGKE